MSDMKRSLYVGAAFVVILVAVGVFVMQPVNGAPGQRSAHERQHAQQAEHQTQRPDRAETSVADQAMVAQADAELSDKHRQKQERDGSSKSEPQRGGD